MARNSGLASEHHHVGPGDAPRRKKGKRAVSPVAEQSSPAKRKRVHADDHDQLAREAEESASRPQAQISAGIRVRTSSSTTRHARRNSEPVVAFADEEEEEEDEHDVQMTPSASTQPLPGLTPHLQRIGAQRGRPTNAARRARMSMPAQIRVEPVDETSGSQIQYAPFKATIDSRTRRRLKRNHLAEEYNDLEEEDKKVRRTLVDLRRKLKEKEEKIKELEFQMEANRLSGVDMTDDETEHLRQQLAQHKEEINELRASSIYRGSSRETSAFDGHMDGAYDDDDEPLMAIDPHDPDGPDDDEVEPLPNGEFAQRVLALSSQINSQVTVNSLASITETSHDDLAGAFPIPDKISDRAVKRYEAEIQRLTETLAEAQGALRVITIELQNLYFIERGASTDVIITELRHAFEAVRQEMENLLPGCAEGLTNSNFLRKLPELFEGVLAELRQKTTTAEKFHHDAHVMRSQYENALDLLERSEARNNDLEAKAADLDQNNELKRQDIENLEERLTTLDALANEQENEIKQKEAQINGLKDEAEDKDTALARLRDAVEQYRIDLDKITETTTRLEEEHRQTIAEMEQRHAAAVQVLEQQLQEESEARLQAEGEAEQKSDYIDELQDNVQRIENEVNTITEDLVQLRSRLATEVQEHEQTKLSLQGEQDHAYSLENKIENLDEALKELQAELAEGRANLDTERAQRKETEDSLDQANQRIEKLESRLRDEGIQANELRSKLFQAQEEKRQAIENLQTEAEEREADFRDQLAAETQARGAAEQNVALLGEQVTELSNRVNTQDQAVARFRDELANLTQHRDEEVTTLDNQLSALHQKYAALENTSNSTIATLQANITDLTNEVNAQKADIERITAEAADVERSLRDEVAEKNEQIASLEENLLDSHKSYAKLEKEHTDSIESFSQESNQFFKMQDKFVRERTSLEKKAKDLAAEMKAMRNEAEQRAVDHDAAIVEKKAEIQELQVLGDTRAQTIVELQGQIEDLKEAFATAEQDTRETIDALTEAQRGLQVQNEELAAALKKRNADTLMAVREMQVKGVQVKSKKNLDLHKVTNGKVTKVSEKVRVGKKGRKVKERNWRDSGFGADSDIENGEVGGEMEEVVG